MKRSRSMALVAAVLLSPLGAGGCAGRSKTVVERETVHHTNTVPAHPGYVDPEEQVKIEHEVHETHVTKESQARPAGLLSTSLHVVGEVLALPFRVVAGLIQLIF